MSTEKDKQLAYTVQYCPEIKAPDMRGTRSTTQTIEGYYRVRELDPVIGGLIPAMSGDLTSMKGESKEDFLARVKESPKYQGWTYIPS